MIKNIFYFVILFFYASIAFTNQVEWVVPNIYMGYFFEEFIVNSEIARYVSKQTDMSVEISIDTVGSDLYLKKRYFNSENFIEETKHKLSQEDDWYRNWIIYKSFDLCEA